MNLPDITVRAAAVADTAAMTALAYHSKKSNGYDDQVMALFKDALHVTPDRLTQRRFWVAELDGRIVGCIALDPLDATSGEVRSFFTDPEHRGRGIGHQLWQELLTIAMSQGLTRLLAHADPASVRYYENLGFVLLAQVPSRSLPDRMVPYMARPI